MPALKESKIEEFAFDYLANHYANAHHATDLLVKKNHSTKQGHNVDGIFVYKTQEQSCFTASLHIASSEQLSRLLINYKNKGLGKARYVTALLSLAAVHLAGGFVGHWLLVWVLPVVISLAAFVAHSLLEEHRLRQKIKRLVDAMKKQAADEQWIGLSISSLCFCNNFMAQYFLELCKRRGIGLITVGKRAKVVLMQEPQTKVCRRGDFLSHYSGDADIRLALLKDTYLRAA